MNPASGLCLDDPGASTTNGTQLDAATCVTGDTAQVWPLPAAQGPPAPPASGPVYVQEEQSDTNVPCLDDANNAVTTGNVVQLWTCRGDPEQNWTVEAGGTIQINGSYCLDSSGGATAQGTPVVLDPCNGSSSQVWTPGANGSLVQQASGMCLDDPDFATGNGTQMQIYACNGGSNQAWWLPTV